MKFYPGGSSYDGFNRYLDGQRFKSFSACIISRIKFISAKVKIRAPKTGGSRKGQMAEPLPLGWEEKKTPDGRVFYI